MREREMWTLRPFPLPTRINIYQCLKECIQSELQLTLCNVFQANLWWSLIQRISSMNWGTSSASQRPLLSLDRHLKFSLRFLFLWLDGNAGLSPEYYVLLFIHLSVSFSVSFIWLISRVSSSVALFEKCLWCDINLLILCINVYGFEHSAS